MTKGRLEALDGLRAVAVLAVVVAHIGWYAAHGGFLGVDVFFVLSGYLITRILADEHERTAGVALARFYMRRVLRLYPALIASVLLALALSPWVYDSLHRWAAESGLSVTYLMDVSRSAGYPSVASSGPLGVTWSLAVEEHFYLLWPVVLAWLLRGYGRRLAAWASVAIGMTCWGLWLLLAAVGVDGDSLYFQPELRSAALFVGCALALFPVPRVRRLGVAAGVGLLALLQFADRLTSAVSFGVFMPLTWLATAAVIASIVASPDGVPSRVLSFAPLAYIGRISYGVYLYHLMLIGWIGHWHLRFALRMPLFVLVPIAVAAASYHLIEQPFLRLKDARFGSSRQPQPGPGAMPSSSRRTAAARAGSGGSSAG